MSERDELILLGELKGFREEANKRFDAIDEKHATFEEKLEILSNFKLKTTVIVSLISGGVVVFFQVVAWALK